MGIVVNSKIVDATSAQIIVVARGNLTVNTKTVNGQKIVAISPLTEGANGQDGELRTYDDVRKLFGWAREQNLNCPATHHHLYYIIGNLSNQ